MNSLIRWLGVIVFSMLVLQSPLTHAQERSGVTIKADTITHEKKTSQATASGAVSIVNEERSISGDEAEYNLDTGEGSISGSVMFRDEDRTIYCERAEINAVTGLGELYNARGNFGNRYFFSGEKIARIEEERYLIENGQVTSCPQEEPHWTFNAGKIDFTVEKSAWMEDVFFRINGTSVFYLPYMIAPADTKRKTGFLTPDVGYSDIRGYYLANSFFWAIAQNMDATFSHKYYSEIGDGFDLEYRYIFAPGTFGHFYAEYLFDPDNGQEEGKEMWKIDFDHRHDLPYNVTNVTRIEKESDYSIDSRYSDNVANLTKRYTDSYTTFSRSWASRSLTLTVREQETIGVDNDESLLSAPSVVFSNPTQSIGGTKLYGGFDMSLVSYKQVNNYSNDPFEVTRINIAPTFSLPLTLSPWLSLTANAGYRALWYSALTDEENTQADEERSINYHTAGLIITGPKFFRIFDTTSSSRPLIKNLIIPTVTWSYTPGYEEQADSDLSVKVIDSLDSFEPINKLTYQLTSELLGKDVVGEESSRTTQIMRLSLQQSYDINEAKRKDIPEDELRPLSPALIDLDTRFLDWVMVNYRAEYNSYDERWSKTHTEIGFKYQNYFHFALDRQYVWGGEGGEDSVWDTAYFELNMASGLSFDYSIIYNEIEGSISNSLLRAKYTEDCWSAVFNVGQKTVTRTGEDGTEETAEDFSVILTITLNGVGEIIGSKTAPLAGRKL